MVDGELAVLLRPATLVNFSVELRTRCGARFTSNTISSSRASRIDGSTRARQGGKGPLAMIGSDHGFKPSPAASVRFHLTALSADESSVATRHGSLGRSAVRGHTAPPGAGPPTSFRCSRRARAPLASPIPESALSRSA